MAFGRADVERLAALARLELPAAELDGLASQLERILGFVEQLEDDGPPGTVPAEPGAAPPARPDEPARDPLHRPPGDFAAGFADGFFTVPRLAAFDGERGGGEG